jgi:hypothetical protein
MNETLEQKAEENINRFFGNRLSPEERTWALQIVKEIFWEWYFLDSKALALEKWRERVTQFDRDIQTRLTQAETPEERSTLRFAYLFLHQIAGDAAENIFEQPQECLQYLLQGIEHAEDFLNAGETAPAVREQMLKLYVNAGVTQKKLGQPQAELDTYQKGLQYAKAFLNDGETASVVRATVLKLYVNAGGTQSQLGQPQAELLDTDQKGIQHAQAFLNAGETTAVREEILNLYESYSSTYYNIGQSHQVITLLPYKGLWSWVKLNKEEYDESNNIWGNWQNKLEISPSFPHFTAAFQELLYTIVTVWHEPQKKHRHFGFLPTEKLLAICESLYAIAQAKDNQRLKEIYAQLQRLEESPIVESARDLPLQQQVLKQQIQHDWQMLDLQPTAFDELTTLKQLSWWQRIRNYGPITHLKDTIREYQQLPQPADFATNAKWQREVEKAEKLLFQWLADEIEQKLQLPPIGLEELGAVVLGILLANSTQENEPPEQVLEMWQHNVPWQQAEALKTALGNGWQTYAKANKEASLSIWLDLLAKNPTLQRLNIAQEIHYFEQPDLQTWLKQLLDDQPEKLISRLNYAWEQAQKQARQLTLLLQSLALFDYQDDLFIAIRADPDACYLSFQTALAMIILGDASQQVRQALQTWLHQQGPFDENTPVLETLTALKNRLTRTALIYQPKYPPLANLVHNWSQVCLRELLSSEQIENLEDIWQLLERSRIGLTGLTLQLEDHWDEKLGEQLWKDLEASIRLLREGYQPTDDKMWPLLVTWFKYMDKWTHNKPPSVEACQNALGNNEALVQPFLDPAQQRFRVLWLDNNGLDLRDLPNDCAPESVWTDIVEQLRQNSTAKTSERGDESATSAELEKVMKDTPVQSLINQLNDWATDLERLTVIWPAPLGQFPWEIVSPSLEPKLMREVTVRHWLDMHQAKISTNPRFDRLNEQNEIQKDYWVLSDPSGEKACMVKEGQWVANYFNTQLDAPCPSIFDALYKLAQSKQSHLSVHGQFDRQNPTGSCLSLNDNQKQYWPLWTISATRTNADLIMLSACESNLTGPDTQGLLTPIGLGPSLVAAGAKTVVGTLWQCNGLAALCFNYYFYQIATEPNNANKPWHHIAAEARQKLRNLQRNDLQQIINECDLENENDLCHQQVEKFQAKTRISKKPFYKFEYWAGFVVLGNEEKPDRF